MRVSCTRLGKARRPPPEPLLAAIVEESEPGARKGPAGFKSGVRAGPVRFLRACDKISVKANQLAKFGRRSECFVADERKQLEDAAFALQHDLARFQGRQIGDRSGRALRDEYIDPHILAIRLDARSHVYGVAHDRIVEAP